MLAFGHVIFDWNWKARNSRGNRLSDSSSSLGPLNEQQLITISCSLCCVGLIIQKWIWMALKEIKTLFHIAQDVMSTFAIHLSVSRLIWFHHHPPFFILAAEEFRIFRRCFVVSNDNAEDVWLQQWKGEMTQKSLSENGIRVRQKGGWIYFGLLWASENSHHRKDKTTQISRNLCLARQNIFSISRALTD